MGAVPGVAGIDAGVASGTAGIVGIAVACGFGVAGVVDATSVGCTGCAGLVGAGCGTEIQGQAGTSGVVVVVSGTVLAGLTLHSCRCCLMWW